MNDPKKFAILAAVLAAAVFIFLKSLPIFIDANGSRRSLMSPPSVDVASNGGGPNHSINYSKNTAFDPGKEASEPETSFSTDELISRKRNAESAVALDDLIEQAKLLGLAAAKDWRLELDALCNPTQIEDSFADADNPHARLAAKFCEGYLPKSIFGIHDFSDYMLALSETVQQKTFDDLLDSSIYGSRLEVDDEIKRFLRQTIYEEEVQALADYLSHMFQEGKVVVWNPVDSSSAISNSRMVQLQIVAIELYSCRKFQSCGNRSIKMIQSCAFVPICDGWWSYEDFIAASLPQFELDYVYRVIDSVGG
jgi:hypothetical protein